MKKGILILLISCCLSGVCMAQWNTKIGINVVPLITKTLDIESEFSYHPGFAFQVGIGGTFNTSYQGLIHFDVYDGIEDRRTSGAFFKAGGKLYLNNLKGVVHRNNFFIGATGVFSYYHQKAMKRDLNTEDIDNVKSYPVEVKGLLFAPTISTGFWHRLNDKLSLEWGVQVPLYISRNNFLGLRDRNFQPGLGSGSLIPYLQGILMLKYQL